MSGGAKRFKNPNIKKQDNEIGRLLVLGGPDHGSVFVISSALISIGRGEENDVMIADLKSSRRHAEVSIQEGSAIITDMGSINGLLVNGKQQKRAQLMSGDRIGIGTTVFEFMLNESGVTKMIQRPVTTHEHVGTGNSGLTSFIVRPTIAEASKTSAAANAEVKSPSQSGSFFERNKKMILGLGAILILSSILPTVENQVKKKKVYVEPPEINAPDRSLSSYMPALGDNEAKKNADVHYREGLRELRALNYLRAQAAFELALQLRPDHAMAKQYRQVTIELMKNEAKAHISKGKKEVDANRLKNARLEFEAVKRLYFRDQGSELYKEAEVHLKEIELRTKDGEKD